MHLLHSSKCCLRKCDQRMTSQYVTSEYETSEFGRLVSQHFLRWQKIEKLIFKYERIALTKLYFVYWFIFFAGIVGENMMMWRQCPLCNPSDQTSQNSRKTRKCLIQCHFVVTPCLKIDTASKFKMFLNDRSSDILKMTTHLWFSVNEIWRFLQGRFLRFPNLALYHDIF